MAATSLVIHVSPDATAYDADYPTRSQELLANQLHNMIVDLQGTGEAYVTDETLSPTDIWGYIYQCYAFIKVVFDYAKTGIVNFRDHGTPDLEEPTWTIFGFETDDCENPRLKILMERLRIECYQMLYKIYYMWETEEDPLRVKDFIRDMLLAWPLHDIEIQLNEEAGKALRVYPVWKDADV